MKLKYKLHKAIGNFEFEEIEIEAEIKAYLDKDIIEEIGKLQKFGWSSTAEFKNKKGFPVLPLAGLTDKDGKKL